MATYQTDVLIIGGGILGLSLAKKLLDKGVQSIDILEKESQLGFHASGRNSGVLHAGVYYPPESLKAKCCLSGNKQWVSYCKKNQIPVLHSGKLIVSQTAGHLESLEKIYQHGVKNGADLERISEKKLKELEPSTTTTDTAILVKDTAVVNPKDILKALYTELKSRGVTFHFNTAYVGRESEQVVRTSRGTFQYQKLFNVAGAFADRIAHDFNMGLDYALLPFKGFYKKLHPRLGHQIKHLIYPTPDLDVPFLGIHVTVSVKGDVYLGPTAVPVLGPEQYESIGLISTSATSCLKTNANLFFNNSGFRKLAYRELSRYLPSRFYEETKQLLPHIKPTDILPCFKVGIRPQLVHRKQNQLVMDFVVESADNHIHVLNAISPAFTSALSFSDYIIQHYF